MEATTAIDLSRTLILLLIFLAVAIPAALVADLGSRKASAKKRVQNALPSVAVGSSSSLRADENKGAWTKLVNLVEERGLSLQDTKSDLLRRKLIAAGYTHPAAPRLFTLLRLCLTIALPATFLLLGYAAGNLPSLFGVYLWGAGLGLAGLYLPNLFISAKADRRKEALVNGFPDALDLMLVCVEAGLGLEAAFARVGSEMSKSHPHISEMLATVVLELRAGRSREDALRRMADRVAVDEIKSFATLLIQSSKLGSSIAQTLRIYSAEMREKRKMRAEEKAHKLPVLISLPLVGCMLPVMIGVLMLPAAIRVVRDMLPALGGTQ